MPRVNTVVLKNGHHYEQRKPLPLAPHYLWTYVCKVPGFTYLPVCVGNVEGYRSLLWTDTFQTCGHAWILCLNVGLGYRADCGLWCGQTRFKRVVMLGFCV